MTFSRRPLGQTLLELLLPFVTSFDSLREMSFGDFHLNNMSQFSGCRFRFEPTLSSSLPSFGRESPVGGVSLVRERGRIGRDGFGEEVAGCDLNRIFWPIILAYDSLGGRHHALVSHSRVFSNPLRFLRFTSCPTLLRRDEEGGRLVRKF